MPVLNRLPWTIPVLAVVAGLTICSGGSPAYQHIKSLPWQEWDSYAQSLPIEERLDLNSEIEERSGHSNGDGLSAAFDKQPLLTYKAIVSRMERGDKSRHYYNILYTIDKKRGFSICAQPDRRIVQSYIWERTGYPEHYPPPGDWSPLPDFFSC